MNIDWSKRLKSFGMAAASLIGTALVASFVSPEFQALIANLGVPATIVSVLALMLAEAWKEFLNSRTLAKTNISFGARKSANIDLY